MSQKWFGKSVAVILYSNATLRKNTYREHHFLKNLAQGFVLVYSIQPYANQGLLGKREFLRTFGRVQIHPKELLVLEFCASNKDNVYLPEDGSFFGVKHGLVEHAFGHLVWHEHQLDATFFGLITRW